jgi:hypothetical protein
MGIWRSHAPALEEKGWHNPWVLETAAAAEYTYGDELITNGTFNANDAGWDPTGGTDAGYVTDPHEGPQSVALRRGGNAAMSLYQAIATEIGSEYLITAYCKVGTANGTSVAYLSAGPDHDHPNSIATSLVTDSNYTETWTQIELVFTAIDTSTTICLRHWDSVTDAILGYGSKAIFDEVSCKKRTEV